MVPLGAVKTGDAGNGKGDIDEQGTNQSSLLRGQSTAHTLRRGPSRFINSSRDEPKHPLLPGCC